MPLRRAQTWRVHESSINLGDTCLQITGEKEQKPDSWRGCLYSNNLSYPRILNLFIEWLRFLVLISHMTGKNRE